MNKLLSYLRVSGINYKVEEGDEMVDTAIVIEPEKKRKDMLHVQVMPYNTPSFAVGTYDESDESFTFSEPVNSSGAIEKIHQILKQ